jgi:hypothetical protein
MKAKSLTSLIFKELLAKDITENQENFLDSIAPIVVDFKHDFLEPPSSSSMALSVACDKTLYDSLSNSMGLWGENHFVFSKVIDQWRRADLDGKVFGLGHPKFKLADPRVVEIERLARENKVCTRSFESFKSVAYEKKLPVNLAGCLAMILYDMGFTEDNVDFFPMVWRLTGLAKLYCFLKDEIKLGPGIDCIKKAYSLVYPHRNEFS